MTGPEHGTHVLVVGSPSDGFKFIGPVTPNDPALEHYTDRVLPSSEYWWYADLTRLPATPAGPPPEWFGFTTEEADILVTALVGAVENRADDVDNLDPEADNAHATELIGRITLAVRLGHDVPLTAGERNDLCFFLGGPEYDPDSPEHLLAARLAGSEVPA